MDLPREPGRGREAERPKEIPKKGWRDILTRVYGGLSRDNATVVAAGIAFYAFISIPAILTALVSIYGLAADPSQIQAQAASLGSFIPGQALSLVMDQLKAISSHSGRTLTVALAVSTGFALYSASNGMKAMMSSLNLMYEENERRGFFGYNAMAIFLTLGALVLVVVLIALVVGITAIVGALNLPQIFKSTIQVLRWPILAFFMSTSLAFVYRYGPSREKPKWKWVSWGATLATSLWLIASAGFSWYVGKFGNYNKTYGSLAAIVVLLMWLYISAYVVLLGAKVNAEMEHQTDRDTTTGQPVPMGTRGAKMADTRGQKAA